MASDYRIARTCSAMLLLFTLLPLASAFYIPGWSIKSYAEGDMIPLLVNKVYSDNTQIQYAFSELPFVCPPSGRKHAGSGLSSGSSIALNLGEVLRGDRIMVSDYELEMGKDEEARYLCSQKVDKAGLRKAIEVVKNGYMAEWLVDNLPGATSFVTVDKSRKYYASGFRMGYEDMSLLTGQPRYYLNNHVTLVLRWHNAPGKDGQHGKKVIVGFEVYAKSIEAENRDASGLPASLHDVQHGLELTFNQNATNASSPTIFESIEDAPDDATITIPYTYSVYFREEERIEWANRWDLYFVNQEDNSQIHWLAIINSLVISGLLTAVVGVILARTIRGDILRGDVKSHRDEEKARGRLFKRSKGYRSPRKPSVDYSTGGLLEQPHDDTSADADTDDDLLMEDVTGWKLLHTEVFRPPPNGLLLAPLIGSGMQLFLMSLGLIVLSTFGFLNPSFRGGFLTFGIALWVFAGVFSGYFSAKIYKTYSGTNWRHNALVTATALPGFLFTTIFVLNLFVWAQSSSTAIPLGTLVALVALWLCVQLPLVYLGSWYGFFRSGSTTDGRRGGPIALPPSSAVIPRQIPPQTWYSQSSAATVLLAGLVPFAVIFIELLFVFRSLWQDKSGYYYLFGFLGVTALIQIAVVMEVVIIGVYVMLCSENYHWHWHSFLLGASSSAWIFAYCVYYFVHHLHIQGFVSSLLFFAYSGMVCGVYGLGMGTVGFLTAWAFVGRIYGGVKVD